MKTRSHAQFRRAQAAHLAARIQKRPWKDSEDEPDQTSGKPQRARADFSQVDLFAHAPQRSPIQTQISPLAQTQAQLDSIAPIQRFESGSSVGPADVVAQTAFNPMDILHKLLIAIDQSDIYIPETKGGWAASMNSAALRPGGGMRRKVNFAAVVSALSNLTAAEAQAVKQAYADHERRSLYKDLFETGQSGFETDLTDSQRAQIHALLAGTRAESGASAAEQQAASTHVSSTQAAEMQRLLHGDRGKADVDRIMAILRQSLAANAALDAAYQRLTGTSLEIGRLKPIDAMRASMLLVGSVAAADTFNVSLLKSQIATIDQEVKEINEAIAKSHELSLENVLSSQVGSDVMRQIKLQQLRKERQQLVEEIQQRGEQVAAEAQTKGESVKERVGAVFGNVEGLTQQVKGPDAVGIRAIAQDDPVAKVVAQLRKAKEADELSAVKLAAALRGLRAEAEERARRMLPPGDPGVESKAVSLADEYFGRLRTEYNALVPKGGDSFDEIINETGNKGDEILNQSLWVNAGRLEEVEELVLALNGDRKDTESVERVLRNKSAIEIQTLKDQYLGRTGKSLDFDLFGQAPTKAGEANPQWAGGYYLKSQGKSQGTSRLNLEDYMQRPSVEGGLEEVLYTMARAEREYEFTVENRGVTGWWRDTWGNEQRALLDETLTEMHQLKASYLNLVGWMPMTNTVLRPEAAKSGAAKSILQKLRLARHTIRGDRAAYEKATAELRETFNAIASFVIQAALTALLTPAAGALFKGAMAARGVMAVRMLKWVETLAVNAASSVGGNLMVQGSDYSLALLKADLMGAIGGQLGSDTIEKMLGPVAKGLAARLGDKCSAEITALAKTVGNIEGGAWAQGNAGDLSLQNVVKTHLMGKGSEVITKGVTSIAGLEPTSPTPGTGSKESGAALAEPPGSAHEGKPREDSSLVPVPAEPQNAAQSDTQPARGEATAEPKSSSKPASEPIVHSPAARSPGSAGKAQPEQFRTMTHEQLLDIFTRATRRPGPGGEVFEVYASREAYDDSYRNLTGDEIGSMPQGFVVDGMIHLPPNASVLTVLHESLHWASSQSHAREILGGFVEEGITEALARRIGGPEAAQIYESNVAFVAELTGIVGEKTLDQAFLHRQWGALRSQLVSHLGSEVRVSEFYDLLRRIDPDGAPPEAIDQARRMLQKLPADSTSPDIVVPEDLADSEPTLTHDGPVKQGGLDADSSQAGMMGSGPPTGTVLQAHDPHDLPSAYLLYKKLIAADPGREVSLLYNHATDQWAIVQGDRSSVNVHQAMQDKGWEVHETTTARHSHPTGLDNQTSEYNHFPSGRGGDLSHIEAKAVGSGDSQWHAIDITTAAGPDRTWVMRTQDGLWTVDYPDLADRGGRGRVSFTSLEQYQNWFQNRFGFSPDRAASPIGATLNAPVIPPNQPTKTGSHLDQLAQEVQVPVLTGLTLGAKLQSSGDAGSLSANGPEFGGFPATLADGTPVVVKVYPKLGMEDPFSREVRALAGAQAAGVPKLYGLVYVDDQKLAVAMELIPGGFPSTVGKSAAAADLAEAAGHAANMTAATVQDVETYGQRLWQAGYYSYGEVQGFVDGAGRWRPIDVQGLKKRTGAPNELGSHQGNIAAMVNELKKLLSQRLGP